MNEDVIGIDIGGTVLKLGRFTREGSCLETIRLETPQPASPIAILEAIVPAISVLRKKGNCLAVGIGMPGPADPSKRIARMAINLPDWLDVPLADWLETETGLPTVLENDANCAGIGEQWLGAGQQFNDFLFLTLGTGVGGAIILDNHLFTGRSGAAGDLGLMTLNFTGPPCNSGNRGSLEQYASAQAILRETDKIPAVWGALADAGDAAAIAFWQNYGKTLGAGLASLIYILTPEAIIIGGGISASCRHFLPSARREIDYRVQPSTLGNLKLLTAQLGNRAGMIGAAKLAWNLLTQKS